MRVGIVGGGITGLALTHALARRGVESVLFERRASLGGVIRTRHDDDRVLELGAQRTRLVPPVRRLVEELGLESEVLEARPGAELFIWTRGRLRRVPRSPGRLLRGDLLTPSGRARVACEPLTRGLRADESVAAYFRRKTGDEAYRTLFGPLISATFASDPDAMPARRALPMLLDPLGVRRSLLLAARRFRGNPGARACTFRQGLATLCEALGERHAERVRPATPVEGLERSGERFVISHGGARSGAVEVEHVVLTAAAPDAAPLLDRVAPDAARRLARLVYNQVCTVPLEVEAAPEGFGFQVALGEAWHTRGVTWNASLFGRTGVCTAYLGGGLDPEATRWTDDRVGATAAEEYARVHGSDAKPLAVGRSWLPAYDGSWSALDGLRLPAGITLAASYAARLGISARIAEAETVAERLAGDGG